MFTIIIPFLSPVKFQVRVGFVSGLSLKNSSSFWIAVALSASSNSKGDGYSPSESINSTMEELLK